MGRVWTVVWTMALASVVGVTARAGEVAFRGQIEAADLRPDWILQEQVRVLPGTRQLSTEADAVGGCDGVKDGLWGFHTGWDNAPWWQVDLGAERPIARVVIWNRCDAASRASRLAVRMSSDAQDWRTVYTHDGTAFFGFTDNKPLTVALKDETARYVRIQLPEPDYLHLDEVEVFDASDPARNLALGRPANQVSVSQWSSDKSPAPPVAWAERARAILEHCRRRTAELPSADRTRALADIETMAQRVGAASDEHGQDAYVEARRLARKLALSSPTLDFDAILFTKRVPGSFNHMSDQYYGWWSRPGGGIYILRDFKGDAPRTECISSTFKEPGSFLRPALSYDGGKVLFAWCKHYPNLAGEPDKLNKAHVPEDAFYHLFEMNIDGSGVRQLTHGKYDDVDARYLPDGRIVFLSTRRGQFLQCGPDTAARTLVQADLPDSYVRCGGGPERPVAVYTLHTMDADGANLCAISPFEMFEWTPSVAHDGTILYSRWDYIDRSNMPYMSLWSIHPDGSHARLVYKNFTTVPHCTFEPQCIPNSNKIVFTGSAHHAQTMGSLVLLDPTVDTEGAAAIKRLTPEVVFPEAEGWPTAYFASPWPLSENQYLVAWGREPKPVQGGMMAANDMGLYLLDADGTMDLLYRDPEISCMYPIPLRPQPRPPVLVNTVNWDGQKEGRFVLADVYRGLKTVRRGDIKALRIVAVPPKTHPTMNFPNLGLTTDDPGKCVLGTVPVEPDGSACFRVPSSLIVFFQALDARGMAVQTMRSVTYVQPGQTISCVGCHESRQLAPASKTVTALRREPSKITPGPEGSWPLRFDRLVQPVLDQRCVQCHNPAAPEPRAPLDLTPAHAYDALCQYGKPSLTDTVKANYALGRSTEGACVANTSPILASILDPKRHPDLRLDATDVERIVTWLDTYGQRLGSFSDEQERDLVALREHSAALLTERGK